MLAISHITPAPFTQQVVRAMLEECPKVQFFTTLTPDGHDWAARILRATGAGKTRQLTSVPTSVVRTYPWREVGRLALGRISRDEVVRDRVFHWARDGFDEWVARQMRPPFGLVYGYETECLETFRSAKANGVHTVYDLPAAEHDFVERLMEEEVAKHPVFLTEGRRQFRASRAERTARRHEEFRLADKVCANSSFTRDTWVAAGLDASKVNVIPLGAPVPDSSGAGGGSGGLGPLRLVWAGKFSMMKGAHYLLEAWRAWSPRHAQLDVYGTINMPTALRLRPPEGVTFHGPVPQSRVLEAFRSADALVFPTLCDGFGLVVNEALSRGLPVITTRRAGASDLIESGRNGLIIQPGSSAALTAALNWCADNRASLTAMRTVALETAAKWQWSDYRLALRATLAPLLAAS